MSFATASLGELLVEARPGFASGDDLDRGIFQIRMNNLSREGRLVLDKRRRVAPDNRQVERCLLEAGDVLFNATNSPDLVGKTAFFSGGDEPMVYSNHFIRLRTRPDVLDGRFLAMWLQREFERGYFKANCKQWVNQATFGKDRLVELQIPVPPVDEQRRIAAVLDAADAIRGKRRRTLAMLDSLTEAVFVDMFGDLSAYAGVCFGSLLTAALRNGISPSKSGSCVGDVLTLSAITRSAFDDLAVKASTFDKPHAGDKTVSVDDFLICRGNGNLDLVGRGKWPTRSMPGVAFPDTMIAARCDVEKVAPGYLEHAWHGASVRRQLEASARTTNGTYKINQTMIESVLLPLPPVSEQRRFDAARSAIDAQRLRGAIAKATMDKLFASLQQRAFRGDL